MLPDAAKPNGRQCIYLLLLTALKGSMVDLPVITHSLGLTEPTVNSLVKQRRKNKCTPLDVNIYLRNHRGIPICFETGFC